MRRIGVVASRLGALCLAFAIQTARADVLPAATAETSSHLLALRFPRDRRLARRPLLDVLVNGRAARLLLDTGTTTHLLSEEVAARLGLAVEPLGSLSNHYGKETREEGVRGAVIAAGDWTLSAGLPVAVAKPGTAWGYDGLLSPQLVDAPTEAVVLDLPHGRLAGMPWEAAAAKWRGHGLDLAAEVRVCQVVPDSPKRVFLIPAEVEGEKVQLMLDTGADRSTLFRESPAGGRLQARATAVAGLSYSLSETERYSVLPSARLAVGPYRATLNIPLIPGRASSTCPRDGALGLDVLRRCVIAISGTRLLLQCSPPRER